MLFYRFSTHAEQIFVRAKERMNLITELNMTEARLAVELDDPEKRLRILDETPEEVGHILRTGSHREGGTSQGAGTPAK